MACAVDASSPLRQSGTPTTTGGSNTVVTASFTAPANSLLVLALEIDGNDDAFAGTFTISDSSGLTWTEQVRRSWSETTAGGASFWFTAPAVSSTSRTVTLTRNTGTSGALQLSMKLYVVTGADISGTPVDSVTASNEGGSATNNLNTTSVTPGANGLLFAASCDWNNNGNFEASSNLTQDTTTFPGTISICDGYRTCSSGVALTANLNAGGTGTPQHKWSQIIVREAAGGGATSVVNPSTLTMMGVQ